MISFSAMVNSWSLLYDELNMDEHSNFNQFTGSHVRGGMGEDHISFPDYTELDDGMRPWGHSDYEFLINNNIFNMKDIIPNSPATPWKYNEEAIVKELLEYIRGTYNQHYSAGDDKIQTLDLIEACGDGEAFCRSNILKYASRYDKKGTARRDIMKILHYAVLLMNFNDKNAVRETYPQ
jgi:hypothetical protein